MSHFFEKYLAFLTYLLVTLKKSVFNNNLIIEQYLRIHSNNFTFSARERALFTNCFAGFTL